VYTPEEIREAGLDDFRVFLRQVWDHLELPPPTRVQNDIAHWLQHGPDRSMTQASRGIGKSWITVAYAAWRGFLDPQVKIMVVSASEGHAIDFSTFLKQLINSMPLLQHLRNKSGQRDSNLAFDFGPATPDKSPSVKSVGITGQLTGSRADLIIPDDIETPKNSYTHVQRTRLASLVKEFGDVLKPGGQIRYLGTPQVESSLYNLLTDRGYAIRIWPAEIPEKPEKYRGKLAPLIARMIESGAKPHDPVEPSRFPEAELAARRIEHGRSGYALQYLLDTSPASREKHPLKLSDLMVDAVDTHMAPVRVAWGRDKANQLQDLDAGGLEGDCYYSPMWRSDEHTEFTATCMAIDPSGTGKDETAYAVVRLLHSQLYLVASGGFTSGFSEATLNSLAGVAAQYGVNNLILEENYGGGMFASLLLPALIKACKTVTDARKCALGPKAPKAGVRLEEVWHTGQKEFRILDTLEPIVQSHRLIVDRRVIEKDLEVQAETPQYSLIQQFTRMERVKGALAHEDRLEALSMACGFFVAGMAQDQQKAHDKHKDKLLDDELKRFKKNAVRLGTRGYR